MTYTKKESIEPVYWVRYVTVSSGAEIILGLMEATKGFSPRMQKSLDRLYRVLGIIGPQVPACLALPMEHNPRRLYWATDESRGEIVGMMTLQPFLPHDGLIGFIRDAVVYTPLRRTGVARLLLDTIVKDIVQEPKDSIFCHQELITTLSKESKVAHFFVNEGFHLDERYEYPNHFLYRWKLFVKA